TIFPSTGRSRRCSRASTRQRRDCRWSTSSRVGEELDEIRDVVVDRLPAPAFVLVGNPNNSMACSPSRSCLSMPQKFSLRSTFPNCSRQLDATWLRHAGEINPIEATATSIAALFRFFIVHDNQPLNIAPQN